MMALLLVLLCTYALVVANAQLPYNATFWEEPSPNLDAALGVGHHVRCPFATGPIERLVTEMVTAIGANTPSLGDVWAALAINVLNDWYGNDMGFEGCTSTLQAYSTVVSEASGRAPDTVQCEGPLLVTAEERNGMVATAKVALARIQGLLKQVKFSPRAAPLVIAKRQHDCRMSERFPSQFEFRNLTDNLGVIVTAVPMPQADVDGVRFWQDVLAWAVPCAYDSSKRPLLVRLNFNVIKWRRMVSAGQLDEVVSDVQHQLLHAMGFGGRSSGVGTASVLGKPAVPYLTSVPSTFMQQQYGCYNSSVRFHFDDDLLLPSTLKPSAGYVAHFEPRVVTRDVMSAGRGAFMDVSVATLMYLGAVTGHYTLAANASAAGDPSWPLHLPITVLPGALAHSMEGAMRDHLQAVSQRDLLVYTVLPTLDAGCEVHTQLCGTAAGGTQLYCKTATPSAQPDANVVCSADRLGASGCEIRRYPTAVAPSPFGPDSHFGGYYPQSDYCAYRNGSAFGITNATTPFLTCDVTTPELPERSGSSFGHSSRCFSSTLQRLSSKAIPFNARCFKTRCRLGVQVELTASTMDGESMLSCPTNGNSGTVRVNLGTHTGDVECPDFAELCAPELLYIPFNVTFGNPALTPSYPFLLGALPLSEGLTLRQAMSACAVYDATVVHAVDLTVQGTLGQVPGTTWVLTTDLYGYPSSINGARSGCTVYDSDSAGLRDVDCNVMNSVVCARRPPAVYTTPCRVGRPCMLTLTDASAGSRLYWVPEGGQRLSSQAGAALCRRHGGELFAFNKNDLEYIRTHLHTYLGAEGAVIPSLWTGMTAGDVNAPTAVNGDSCVVLALAGGAITFHSAPCGAQFEVLCMLQDAAQPTPSTLYAGAPAVVYQAVVPRTYASATSFCRAMGGLVSPYMTAEQQGVGDAWLYGMDALSVPAAGGADGMISRRRWMGVRPKNAVTPATLEWTFGGSPYRVVPTSSDIGTLGMADGESVYRAVVSGGGLGYGKAPIADPSAEQGPITQGASLGYFDCAVELSVDARCQGADGCNPRPNLLLALNGTRMNFTDAQASCTMGSGNGGAPLFERTTIFGTLIQPTPYELFGLQGSATTVAMTLASHARRDYGAQKGLHMLWTGLVYFPDEDTLGTLVADGTGRLTRFGQPSMQTIKRSPLWRNTSLFTGADAAESRELGYLCVFADLHSAEPLFGTAPCATLLPTICVSQRAYYGAFDRIVAEGTNVTGVEKELQQVRCSYHGLSSTTRDGANATCAALGGGLLELPLSTGVGLDVLKGYDLFSVTHKFPVQTLFWTGVTHMTTNNGVVTGIGYADTPAPYFMQGTRAAPATGDARCYTAMVNDVTREVSLSARGCDEVYPYICCVNIPRVTAALVDSSWAVGDPVVILFTIPAATNRLQVDTRFGVRVRAGLASGATRALIGSFAGELRPTEGGGFTAAVQLPTMAQTAGSVAEPTGAIYGSGGDEVQLTFELDATLTYGLGVEAERVMPTEGLLVRFADCAYASARVTASALRLPIDQPQQVTVDMASGAPLANSSVEFFMAFNTSCREQSLELGVVSVAGGSRSVFQRGDGTRATQVIISVTPRALAHNAALCARFVTSTLSDCSCCGRFSLVNISTFAPTTAAMASLTTSAAAVEMGSSVTGQVCLNATLVSQLRARYGASSVSVTVTPLSGGRPVEGFVTAPNPIVIGPSATCGTVTLFGTSVGVMMGGVRIDPGGVVGTPVLADWYPLGGFSLTVRSIATVTAEIADAFGHHRQLFYPGEVVTVRVVFDTDWARQSLMDLLLGVGVDAAMFGSAPSTLLTEVVGGAAWQLSMDLVRELTTVKASEPLVVVRQARMLNDTSRLSSSSGGVAAETLSGGMRQFTAGALAFTQRMALEGLTFVAAGGATDALIDVRVPRNIPLTYSQPPSLVVLGVPSSILLTLPQAPPSPLVAEFTCDTRLTTQKVVLHPADIVDCGAGEVLSRAMAVVGQPLAGDEYRPYTVQCWLNFSQVPPGFVARNVSITTSVIRRIVPTMVVPESSVLIGGYLDVNVSLPLPAHSFYVVSGVGLSAGQNLSYGLSTSVHMMTTTATARSYVFRVTPTSAAVATRSVCLTFAPLNSTLVAPPSTLCLYIAPPITIAAVVPETYLQPVGVVRARTIELSINSSPFTGGIDVAVFCEVQYDANNKSVATFTPSTVRWEEGTTDLRRTVTLVGTISGAYCNVMVKASGGYEVASRGINRALFAQPLLFVDVEYVTFTPRPAFTKLFPGAANARVIELAVQRQPTHPVVVDIATNAPPGMLIITPAQVVFPNISTDNRTRQIVLTSVYGSATRATYSIWGVLTTRALEFVQPVPQDGIASSAVTFESERIFNISVVDPSSAATGHMTDTTVYCGDLVSATSLIFVSPSPPASPMERVFVTIANIASAPPSSRIRLYTNPAVGIFTTSTALRVPFKLACDVETFPAGQTSYTIPAALQLSGPSEFGPEPSFLVQVKRLERIEVSLDSVATVSSTRIYMDIALSAPVPTGRSLELSLVTSCEGALSLSGGDVLIFAEGDQQRSSRLYASSSAVDGCNISLVQTMNSDAPSFERYSNTRLVRIYSQARVHREGYEGGDDDTPGAHLTQGASVREYSIPQVQARSGFTLIFTISGGSLTASSLRVERLSRTATGSAPVAVTSNMANSEYLRTLMANNALSVRALTTSVAPTMMKPTPHRFEVVFGEIPTAATTVLPDESERVTILFSRYLFYRNDTDALQGFTNFTVVMTPEEVSIVGVQRNTISAAAIAAAILSPVSGPSLAAHFSRVYTLIDVSRCPVADWEDTKQSSLEVFINPIRATVTGDASSMGQYAMAAVMNIVLIVALFCLHAALVAIVFASRINVLSSSNSVLAAMQKVHFPGASIYLLGYFAGIDTEFAMRALLHSDSDAIRAAGAGTLVATLASLGYCLFHVYTRRFYRYDRIIVDEDVQWYWRVIAARGAWVPRPDVLREVTTVHDREKAVYFLDRYGALFAQYVGRWYWYLAADVTFSVAIGVVSAFEPSTELGCMQKSVALTVILSVATVLLLTLRPYNYHLYNIFFAAISICEMVSAIVSVSASVSKGGTYGVRAANISMLVVSNMLLIKLAVDLVLLAYRLSQRWIDARDDAKAVVNVGPESGRVPYTDFASQTWWRDHFGEVSLRSSGRRDGLLLQEPLHDDDGLGDVMMCDLDAQ